MCFQPLILFQGLLALYCVVNILKHGTRSLSKAPWILISLFINFIGPVAYILFGKKVIYRD